MSRSGRSHAWLPKEKGEPGEPFLPEMVFDEGSDYVARVIVEQGAGKEPQLLAFPIQVTAWYMAMVKPALMVVGVLAFIGISFIRYHITSRQQESSVGKVKVRRVAH